jgi:hypothetical protein
LALVAEVTHVAFDALKGLRFRVVQKYVGDPPGRTPVASSKRSRTQAQRYQEAAEAALEQLEWAAAYLRRIQKPQIARALEASRASIIDQYQLNRSWTWRRGDE